MTGRRGHSGEYFVVRRPTAIKVALLIAALIVLGLIYTHNLQALPVMAPV